MNGTIKRYEEAPKCYICNQTGHYARNRWKKGNKEQNSSEVKKKKSEVKVVKIFDTEMSSSEEESYAKKERKRQKTKSNPLPNHTLATKDTTRRERKENRVF
jgi:Zinc knuckle